MSVPLLAMTSAPLDGEALTREVSAQSGGGDGAVITFLGLVRNRNVGRTVLFLEYEAYEPLAVRALERISGETREQWTDVTVGIHHRTGRLEIGEPSIVIVTASPHRADAYAANRYVIERVKQILPVWKKEHFDGGDTWLEGAAVHPDDEEARFQARRIACS